MMMRGVVLSATFAVLLCPGMARAADEEQEKSLGTVVVTATRTEQPIEQATTSISVITGDEIDSRHAPAVIDVLRDVPGVDVSQAGSPGANASVFIRGANADQTLVLLDGVEVNSPTLGDFAFGILNTDNIDRVEVLRGAGGTLYGSEAIGGVVNVISRRGEGTPQFTLLNEGGNGDTQRHRLSFGGSENIVGCSGSLSYRSDGGFQPVNDDYTELASALRLDADVLEHGTLRGFFRYIDSNQGLVNNLNFLTPFTPDPNARFSDELYLFKGEWEHRPVDNVTYRLAGSVVHDSETFTDPDALTSGGFSTYSRIPTQITTGEAQANYYTGNVGITTAGFEFQEKEARPKSTNVVFDPTTGASTLQEQRFNASRSVYSGYLQQQLLLLDERLIGTGGFRVDSDESFGREVSASWSVGYLQDWDHTGRWATRFKGSYAEGFKAPTFNELFFPNFGNPDLNPETSSGYDGGVEQRLWGDWAGVDATYFSRRTKNLIEAALDPTTGLLIAENAGRADVQGVETGVTLEPLPRLTLRGTYTYLDFDVIGGSGTLVGRPHNRMATVVRYQRSGLLQTDDALDLTTNVNFVGDRANFNPTTFTIVNNTNYTVTNATAAYSFPLQARWPNRLGLFTRIANMFDRDYQEVLGFQSPPINFVIGMSLTF
jgi:vitamin B12 transporter